MSEERRTMPFVIIAIGWAVCIIVSGIALGMAWCTRSDQLHLQCVNAELRRHLQWTYRDIRFDACPHHRCIGPMHHHACLNASEAINGERRFPMSRELRRTLPAERSSVRSPYMDRFTPVPDQPVIGQGMTLPPTLRPIESVPSSPEAKPTRASVRQPVGCILSATDEGLACSLRLDAPINFETLTLQRPDRFVLKLKGTHDIDPDLPKNAVAERVRIGIQPDGDTHLVFDLKHSVRNVTMAQDAPNALRITLR